MWRPPETPPAPEPPGGSEDSSASQSGDAGATPSVPDPAEGRSEGAFSWRPNVSEELSQRVYAELKLLAERALHKERLDHTLQPTALANEAWMRLAKQDGKLENSDQFKALASQMIRRILVDHARKKRSDKRGGGADRVTLCEPILAGSESTDVDLLGLDAALNKLKCIGERPHLVVELRFFGGLAIAEVARVLGITESTANKDWRFARAWLRNELDATP